MATKSDLVRKTIKLRKKQVEEIGNLDAFSFSGFIREAIDEKLELVRATKDLQRSARSGSSS